MPTYRPPHAYRHGTPSRIGVLLTNLGTPDAPEPAAVRRYLKEFLSDSRVVEIPRALWWLILNGIILNVRPAKSAAKYRLVWTDEGSPLAVHTARQAKMLAGFLGQRGFDGLVVRHAMRYGNPAIPAVLDELAAAGCDRIVVVPLFPQYAASTTASSFDAVAAWGGTVRNLPAISFVRSFADHPRYIDALARSVEAHWEREGGRPDVLVMSFHGVPRATLTAGDPYHCECHLTARLLAEALGLDAKAWRITFQSRFGRAQWLTPYTSEVLAELGRAKTRRVDVICPGFVADCLETLEEIAMEGKASFTEAGGGRYTYIPALNEDDAWIHALADVVSPHLGALAGTARTPAERTGQRERALALGATQ